MLILLLRDCLNETVILLELNILCTNLFKILALKAEIGRLNISQVLLRRTVDEETLKVLKPLRLQLKAYYGMMTRNIFNLSLI